MPKNDDVLVQRWVPNQYFMSTIEKLPSLEWRRACSCPCHQLSVVSNRKSTFGSVVSRFFALFKRRREALHSLHIGSAEEMDRPICYRPTSKEIYNGDSMTVAIQAEHFKMLEFSS